MESMVDFSIVNLNLYFILPLDPEAVPISKLELFVTIANDFQPLTIVVKISAEFLNLHTTTKDDY